MSHLALLRASGRHDNRVYALAGVSEAAAAPIGVASGDRLLAFADAAIGRDDAALERARSGLVAVLGPEALIDAAAVIGGFDGISCRRCGIQSRTRVLRP